MSNWQQKIKNEPAWITGGIVFLLLVFFTVPEKIPGDAGSGIYHFLYAKSALSNPDYFLNRWANPLFVLVSFPFAQFGIAGLYFFNAVCISLTVVLCCLTATKLGLRFAWLCPFLLLLTPVYFSLVHTALTELFFGLVLIYSVYLFAANKPASAAFFASLLPFAGVEGTWFIFPMAVALIATKKSRFLPNLLFGILFYSAAGFLFSKDLFWWLGKNNSIQNTTSPFVYLAHLELMYGIIVEIFFLAGIVFLFLSLYRSVRNKERNNVPEQAVKNTTAHILLLATVLFFFVMRSVSVATGMFGTIGTDREMAVISSLVALIALWGLNEIYGYFEKTALKKISGIVIAACLIAMGAIMYSKELFPPKLSPENKLNTEVAEWIKKEKPEKKKIYFSQPYFILLLDLDPLEKKNSEELDNNVSPDSLKSGSLVLCSTLREQSLAEKLKRDSAFVSLGFFKLTEEGKTVGLAVFEKKNLLRK